MLCYTDYEVHLLPCHKLFLCNSAVKTRFTQFVMEKKYNINLLPMCWASLGHNQREYVK